MSRVALVTGVSGGIGNAIAERFRHDGWRTVGTDVEVARDQVAADRFVRADLADPAAIESLLESVEKTEGRLDVVVNNAAAQICPPFDALTIDDWDRTMAVNLRAPFWLVRCGLGLLEAAAGAVVNVSSVHAVATSSQMAGYAASKGGLSALTRAMAMDLAPRGIRVNAVLPGAVDTPMLRAGLARGHAGDGSIDAQLDIFAARHPVGRVGRPDEIAEAVLFLSDSERSSYVTGASLVVDGGVTARLGTE